MSTQLASNRNIRLMIGAHLIWLGMVCLLGAWWGRLVLRQAQRIAELESHLGMAVDQAQSHWHRTQRMLFWESGTFFALLLGCTIFLFLIYWRDQQRTRSLHAFFASVTHELRTPLTSIRLQAESISDELPAGNSGTKTLVNRLLEDTHRLEGQVERTLELARVEGGGPVYIQSFPLKPWLERLLNSWITDYRQRVDLGIQIEDTVVNADPMALQIILRNLLENSVKHSKLDKVKIDISTQLKDQELILRIKDNGEGFQGEIGNLGKLFQKSAASSGTGVGLYLAKILMKRMGGKIEFLSHQGFQVSLAIPVSIPEGASHG